MGVWMDNEYGARMERGKIIEKRGLMYRVESLTRRGIKTPLISQLALRDAAGEIVEYAAGDEVYFFVSADGDGLILGPCEGD